MRLSIAHSTIFRFETPQRSVLQSQRLTPADYKGQTVIDWQVVTQGGRSGAGFRDGAGDFTASSRVAGPVSEFEVTATGAVETLDTAGVLEGLREKAAPEAYMRPTRPTRASKGLRELLQSVVEGAASPAPLDLAHALCAAVHDALDHAADPAGEGAVASAEEAFARKAGSCRAQTHVLIALALEAHLPARFVHGYVLEGDPGDGRKPLVCDTGALHGWAEVHVGRLGWVGFDPVNACCPDDRYVRLCSGVDALDAAPIRTVASAQADSDTQIAVALAASGQSQQ